MPLSNFLQCSKHRMRAINSSNSIFKRIGHQKAAIISGYPLLNSVRKRTPEYAGKLAWRRTLHLICVKISIHQSDEYGRLKVTRIRALSNWSGIILQLVLERSLMISFSRTLPGQSFEKIFNPISHKGREIFFQYSCPHSL